MVDGVGMMEGGILVETQVKVKAQRIQTLALKMLAN